MNKCTSGNGVLKPPQLFQSACFAFLSAGFFRLNCPDHLVSVSYICRHGIGIIYSLFHSWQEYEIIIFFFLICPAAVTGCYIIIFFLLRCRKLKVTDIVRQ